MSNILKTGLALVVAALMVVAAMNAYQDPQATKAGPKVEMSARDKAWLRTRLARPTPPPPKPGQIEVLLVWRSDPDGPKARPIVPLVDHPEGVHGVYGMDVTSSDANAKLLRYQDLSTSLSPPGAYLVVVDRLGHPIANTPVLTKVTVQQAFEIGEGKRTSFDYSKI